MRWTQKEKQYASNGDKRIVKRFLLFPLTLNNETRWLEFVEIEQSYQGPYWNSRNELIVSSCSWLNSKFVN